MSNKIHTIIFFVLFFIIIFVSRFGLNYIRLYSCTKMRLNNVTDAAIKNIGGKDNVSLLSLLELRKTEALLGASVGRRRI